MRSADQLERFKSAILICTPHEPFGLGEVPKGLAPMLVNSRRYNHERQLTGMLTYYDGVFLKVLEGSADCVSQYLLDYEAHEQFKKLNQVSESTHERRFFEGSSMKLSQAEEVDEAFFNYISECCPNLSSKVSTPSDLIKFVINGGQLNDAGETIKEALGSVEESYRLTSWPRFDRVNPSRELLELCGMLSQAPLSQNQLMNQNPFDTKQELEKTMARLAEMKLLHVTHQPVKQHQEVDNKAFFSRMRGFIRGLSGS